MAGMPGPVIGECMTFRHDVHRSDDVTCVALAGEIDLSGNDQLRRIFAQELAHAPQRIEVDLSAVTLIDSTSVGILIGSYRAALAAGTRLVVTNVRGMPLRVLRIVGVLEVLTGHPSTPATEQR